MLKGIYFEIAFRVLSDKSIRHPKKFYINPQRLLRHFPGIRPIPSRDYVLITKFYSSQKHARHSVCANTE